MTKLTLEGCEFTKKLIVKNGIIYLYVGRASYIFHLWCMRYTHQNLKYNFLQYDDAQHLRILINYLHLLTLMRLSFPV